MASATLSRRPNRLVREGGFYTLLTLLVIFAALPFYWMLITTFKAEGDLYDLSKIPYIFQFWRGEWPTLENIEFLFRPESYFTRWLFNSFLISTLVVIITLVLSLPAGYALARMGGRWSEHLAIGIFLTYIVPPTVLFIPLSRVVAEIGLQDSLWSLVVVYPTFTVPFCTWIMMGFFKSIPLEIEEAALMDGQNRVGVFLRIVLPLSVSGIFTVVIFSFTLAMQEFVYALTFVASQDQKPVTVGVATDLVRGDIFFWGSLMAAALIAGIPVAILYNIFLDRFITGMTGGAIK